MRILLVGSAWEIMMVWSLESLSVRWKTGRLQDYQVYIVNAAEETGT